ncbi:MAG: TIGR03960 family B12-binding radical SAM protein [Candidatus Omnitrophica bacterium]|nr:TIGR03960 family B12-binding radical SAM protein [Candidatus Omnitrophota bacterium]
MTNSSGGFFSIKDFLLNVRKPARYIGSEFNVVIKPLSSSSINFVLCFPDVYEIGMSHLGIKILYHILNKQDDVYCERCFAPWTDMEEQMREHKVPLFSLETQRPLNEFDIIGFSLQYELSYTNVLNMLELSGLPLYSRERTYHPIIIAGGPGSYNPEPMAPFIDAFFIGEAEESLLELTQVYRSFKKNCILSENVDGDFLKKARIDLLTSISRIDGVYVPRFYEQSYDEEGNSHVVALSSGFPKKINRRFIPDLDKADFFTAPLVPNVEIVHDRVSIEIMRGCPNRCFFCQAAFAINPVRVRSVENLIKIVKDTYKNTGYDELSLCALSSADYPYLKNLISRLYPFCAQKGIGISLPSLRVDKEFLEIIPLLSGLKKSGLTFAPEAGSLRLRCLINKSIDIEQLKNAALTAYRNGWKRIKLYFMIGLPTEQTEDLLSIIEMIEEFSLMRKQVDGRRGQISVGISNFIPKPHTPLQWLGMQTMEQFQQKQAFLRSRINTKNIEVDFHNAEMSFLEAYFCRSDRRAAALIKRAFELGARFDAWQSEFNFSIWQQAADKENINMETFVYKRIEKKAPLVWEHIYCGVEKELLSQKLPLI